jgi:hypothetical protein
MMSSLPIGKTSTTLFRCGALFNSSSIRNSEFLIFTFCVLILIPP